MTFEPRIPIAAITDEFSPRLSEAIPVMKEIGMTSAELRVVDGKNILDLSDDELKRAKETLAAAGLPVISIASPLLKCVLPNAPELDSRFQHDVFASKHTFEDQPQLSERAIKVAKFFGAPIVRVFSYWRTVEPKACFEEIAAALDRFATQAAIENLKVGLENEHACNVGTASEAAEVLKAVNRENLGLVWDPANALVAGENPFPDGYSLLPKKRILHVHAKDCHMEGNTPVWGPLGTRSVRWKEQIAALLKDKYTGYISLETHWGGPAGSKLEASRICGWNLRGLAA
jgi:L-ribulose-5-phosphate 3-epimerase